MEKITNGEIQSLVNANIQGRIGMLLNPTDTVNNAVRAAISEHATESNSKVAILTPTKVMDGYWVAELPGDLLGDKIRGLYSISTGNNITPTLTFEEDMDSYGKHVMSIVKLDGVRKLRFSYEPEANIKLSYYSNKAWVSADGLTYKTKSNKQDDYVEAEQPMLDAIVFKASALAAREADLEKYRIDDLEKDYKENLLMCTPTDELQLESPTTSSGYTMNW